MLIEQKETTFAYRCPDCGATVFSMVGIFSLSGDMLKLRCSCGKSEARITYTQDKKIRLSVPCIACPKPHHFTLGQNSFFAREEGVFCLSCPYTGIDACFIGEKDRVTQAVERSNEELLRLLKQSGMEDISRMREEEDDNLRSENPILEDVVFFMINDLKEEGRIHCKCPEGQESHYAYRLHHGRVTVECESCGAMAVLPMAGVNSAEALLELTHLDLE